MDMTDTFMDMADTVMDMVDTFIIMEDTLMDMVDTFIIMEDTFMDMVDTVIIMEDTIMDMAATAMDMADKAIVMGLARMGGPSQATTVTTHAVGEHRKRERERGDVYIQMTSRVYCMKSTYATRRCGFDINTSTPLT